MKYKKIYASTVAKLDSNVHTGGGTDDTTALQAVLDEAGEDCAVHLIMDGAALVSGLRLYSNTTIECPNKNCGFFQMPQSNRALISCGDLHMPDIREHDISILGGTYNQNCDAQEYAHADFDTYEPGDFPYPGVVYNDHGPYTLDLFGVRQLQIHGLTIRNFKAYAVCIDHFENVTIENTWLELDKPGIPNQDGFHFFGPGRFLTIRNVGGKVGDDFMNIGSDERDRVSSITDVLIDGVFLDHATQAIRLLARYKGSVERVTIRNVSGTYRNFGFYICPWYMDHHSGKIANVLIENIDLVAEEYDYDYRDRMLFCIAGIVENLTIQNIRHKATSDKRILAEFGVPYYSMNEYHRYIDLVRRQSMKGITIKDVTIVEDETSPVGSDYIVVYSHVESLLLKDITILKESPDSDSCLIRFREEGSIGTLVTDRICIRGIASLFSDSHKISCHHSTHIYLL
ncbi:MAG: hypothetical protein J6J43_04755 [Oscillospiraceae bacterium]|nr:hypothetical protein [Oscillospiraceae bacterium]